MWTDGFRFYFTPLPGVLPTFPSRYWFTIGLPVFFSLAGWSPQIRTGFLVPRPTQVAHSPYIPCLYGTITLCGPTFQTVPVQSVWLVADPYNPAYPARYTVWAPPLSIATTQGIDYFFLFLQVLRCFSSLRSPRAWHGDGTSSRRVTPFGYVRITSCLQIPALFRGLPRPSSHPEAKASSVRLDLLSYSFVNHAPSAPPPGGATRLFARSL